MPRSSRQKASFPFLELPAGKIVHENPRHHLIAHTSTELRNHIYERTTDELDCVRIVTRPNPKSKDTNASSPSILLPLAQVCKQLRAEYLPYSPHWLSSLQVGLRGQDLEHFIQTFCRTDNGIVRCPKSITVYVSAYDTEPDGRPCATTDILPLIKLKLHCPWLECSFAADPRENGDKILPGPGNVRVGDAIAFDCHELGKLVNSNDASFLAHIEEKRLVRIMLYPGVPWKSVHVELVFSVQPRVRKIDGNYLRCNLGEVRAFGLEDVYKGDRVYLTMSLEREGRRSQDGVRREGEAWARWCAERRRSVEQAYGNDTARLK